MSKPLISVIMPIYNTADYLERSVGSVLAQDHENLEVILVNDGSTDNSLQICNKLALMDKRIVVISKDNEGVSSARNYGLDAAHGEYIGFVDSDDYIDEDMYSFLIANALENNADISQCGIYASESDCSLRKQLYDSSGALKSLMSYSGVTSHLCNKLYSAKLFGKIRLDKRYPVAEDLLCNYQLLKISEKIIVCSEAKYHYEFRPDSCVNGEFTEKHFLDLDVIDYIASHESDNEIVSLCRIRKVKASLYLIRRIVVSKSFSERYSKLRHNVISEMKNIVFKCRYNVKFNLIVHALLLWSTPWLYNILLRLKYKNREVSDQ